MTDQNIINEKVEAISVGFTHLIQDLIKEARPLVQEATERLSDIANESISAANRGKVSVEITGHDLVDQAVATIRHQPFKAMIIAAGVGAAAVATVSLLSRNYSQTKHR
jgi:ElaB/YqjD/DUF883 family membrane-anchored ribosome-binding protein